MHEELFHIGPVVIRSYGVMLALAFLACIIYVRMVARRDGKPFELYLSVAYIMIFGGIIGARLFYVLFHLGEFADNWLASFNPFASDHFGIAGLNMYGGVLVAVLATVVYCRFKKVSVLDLFDYFAPTLGLGLGLARIGCFFNGCCFGTPTDLPWGIAFPVGSIPYAVYFDAHLHPAQLYSSLYGLGLLVILHYLLKRRRFVGQVVGQMFMLEAVARFAIEYVRFYEDAMQFQFMGMQPTYNQVISLALFLLGLGIYLYQRKRTSNLMAAPDRSELS